MPKVTKVYEFNNLAGCVSQTKSRITGTLVGIYHGEQSGMESDPDCPWQTVCEEHSTLVGHSSLKLAREHAPDPTNWCEGCREALESTSSIKP